MLTPIVGSLVYAALYFIATLFYPGGSQFNKSSKGFSWAQNYWCNLLNQTAINGQPNPARTIALSAMAVLCLTLMIFWFVFAQHIPFSKKARIFIQTSGIVSMTIGMFLFTDLHDVVINVATLFGLAAVTGTFIGLKKLGWNRLFKMGLFNIALVIINNYLYYKNGLLYLPIVQKITFLYFLIWICLIDINLFNRKKNSLRH